MNSLSYSSSASANPNATIILAGVCYVVTAIFPVVWFVRLISSSLRKPSEENSTLLPHGSPQGSLWVCRFFTFFSPSSCLLVCFSVFIVGCYFIRDVNFGLYGSMFSCLSAR